jgi:hypothetical protein
VTARKVVAAVVSTVNENEQAFAAASASTRLSVLAEEAVPETNSSGKIC